MDAAAHYELTTAAHRADVTVPDFPNLHAVDAADNHCESTIRVSVEMIVDCVHLVVADCSETVPSSLDAVHVAVHAVVRAVAVELCRRT